MIVYIIPETRKIAKVRILNTYDDKVEIESDDIINPILKSNTRTVNLLSLYKLINFYFKSPNINNYDYGSKNCSKVNNN